MKKNFIKHNKSMQKLLFLFIAFISFLGCTENEIDEVKEESNCLESITIPTSNAPFTDSFEMYDSYSIPSNKWTSINENGLRQFTVKSYQGNKFVEMTSFNSGGENKAWLISPKFDFSTMVDKNMSFTLADGLQNGNPLKLMYSTNYDGSSCPSDAGFTWVEFGTDAISDHINNTENNDFNFEASGDVSLSTISGNAVIAFVYEGAKESVKTTIQIDDIRIGQSLAFVPSLSISGTTEVGETLTANYSPLVDAGGNSVNVVYQWYRAADATGSNETAISGATNTTYVLVNADSGKYITVKTTVNSIVTTVDYVGIITGLNLPPTAAVTITGTAAVGQVLTADTSASTDPENDPLTFTYQWYRANDVAGAGEIAISGETNSTYTIVAADLGKFIAVKVIANDGTSNSTETTAAYSSIPYSNKVFINELADPNNATRGRFVELYNAGSVAIDLTGW